MTQHYDIFNGDADGICALIQLRLADPKPEAVLVTGVKRDIALVRQVPVNSVGSVTVLDISLDKNRAVVDKLLTAGFSITYIDHHYAGETRIEHASFTDHIDTAPTTCTSLIVNALLAGKYINWAITAAFGDNLIEVAKALALKAGLGETETDQLEALGTYINYNGYGATEADLHVAPAALYSALVQFADPLEVISSKHEVWQTLSQGYADDMAKADAAKVVRKDDALLVISLPQDAWARRVSGVLGNQLANDNPDRAIAVLTELPADTEGGDQGMDYLVSIRAPLNNRTGADIVARQFLSGGGRSAAAGINRLPDVAIPDLIRAMQQEW